MLRRSRACYEWGGHEFQINHLLFMDDLKLFAKSYEQIDSLVQTVHTFSIDIGMEFGIKKCTKTRKNCKDGRSFTTR